MRLSHTTFRFSCPALNRAKRADLSVKFVTGAIIALSVLARIMHQEQWLAA